MGKSFKQWLAIQEIAMGSDGNRDNRSVQTNQAAVEIGQNWLANKRNAPVQANLVQGAAHRSTLGKDLLNAGADAMKTAKPGIAGQTTAPLVANFLQTNLGLPKVLRPLQTSRSMMGKK
jgi:hypothetical protein